MAYVTGIALIVVGLAIIIVLRKSDKKKEKKDSGKAK